MCYVTSLIIVWFVVSAELLLEGDPSGRKETHHHLCHVTVSPTPLFYYTKFHSFMVNLYRILDLTYIMDENC